MMFEQVRQDSVDKLLRTPKTQLDAFSQTIKNAVKAAVRDGKSKYVGFTSLTYWINESPDHGGAVRLRCDPDGSAWRVMK